MQQIGGADHDARQERELDVESLEQGPENRNDLPQNDGHHRDRDGKDDRRVDHGGAQGALQFDDLFDENGQALQDGIEDAAGFPGGDHVGVQGIKYLGMPGHGIREGGSGFHIAADLLQNALEGRVLRAAWPMASRHCTRGSPASSMTENWRVKIATSAWETLLPKEKLNPACLLLVNRDRGNLLPAQHGGQRLGAVGEAFPVMISLVRSCRPRNA